jgi:hypothetical protein
LISSKVWFFVRFSVLTSETLTFCFGFVLAVLSFHFYNHIVWNWDITVTSWLGTIANGARVYNFGDSTAASIQLAFIVVMSVVALFLLDALWVGWQFSESRVRFAFTVKILRGLADLMTGPFYIPVKKTLF